MAHDCLSQWRADAIALAAELEALETVRGDRWPQRLADADAPAFDALLALLATLRAALGGPANAQVPARRADGGTAPAGLAQRVALVHVALAGHAAMHPAAEPPPGDGWLRRGETDAMTLALAEDLLERVRNALDPGGLAAGHPTTPYDPFGVPAGDAARAPAPAGDEAESAVAPTTARRRPKAKPATKPKAGAKPRPRAKAKPRTGAKKAKPKAKAKPRPKAGAKAKPKATPAKAAPKPAKKSGKKRRKKDKKERRGKGRRRKRGGKKRGKGRKDKRKKGRKGGKGKKRGKKHRR